MLSFLGKRFIIPLSIQIGISRIWESEVWMINSTLSSVELSHRVFSRPKLWNSSVRNYQDARFCLNIRLKLIQ